LHLERAIRFEDALIYQEPPDWPAPVRQNLGAVLLQAGRADEAEAVYWEDLRKNPGNGWSLRGLMQALEAQGKKEEAERVRKRFAEAWKHADAEIRS
jgi:tetratricopeptide (TPR) repeat protein